MRKKTLFIHWFTEKNTNDSYAIFYILKALLGSVAAAAYNLTFQLGFATTQICESVAVAVQTLLAREIADDKSRSGRIRASAVRHLINGSIFVGGAVATGLSLITFFPALCDEIWQNVWVHKPEKWFDYFHLEYYRF